jgi:hypothetical protein
LGDVAFATNVGEAKIFQVNLLTKTLVNSVAMSDPSDGSTFSCSGTHGIDYNAETGTVFVECTNPTTCKSPYTNPTNCTASLWAVDAVTLDVKARLVSPTLNATYGGDFGVWGQPYDSPDGTFMIATNSKLNYISVVYPEGKNMTSVLDIPVSGGPSSVLYIPKNTTVNFGDDPDPRNYWAVVGLGSQSSTTSNPCGIAFLNMADVVAGFEAGKTSLSSSVITRVSAAGCSASSENRVMARGMGYIGTYVYESSSAKKITFVDELKQSVHSTFTVSGSIQKIIFVPTITDELTYQIGLLQDSVSRLQSQRHADAVGNKRAVYGIVIASVALAVAVLGAVFAIFAFYVLRCRGLKNGDAAEEADNAVIGVSPTV